MKKAAIDTVEPIDRLHKSALPQISYSQCMGSYFLTRSGEIRSVESASAEEFSDLVEACSFNISLRTAQSCRLALKGLDYHQPLDKWFAVCELLMASAKVPIFATSEQARQSLLQPIEVQVR